MKLNARRARLAMWLAGDQSLVRRRLREDEGFSRIVSEYAWGMGYSHDRGWYKLKEARLTFSETEYNDMRLTMQWIRDWCFWPHQKWMLSNTEARYDHYKDCWEKHNYDPDQLPFNVVAARVFKEVAEAMK